MNKFKILNRHVCKLIRASLRDHGAWLRSEETHPIARSLYDCVKADKNLCLDENNNTTSELEAEKSLPLPLKNDEKQFKSEQKLEPLSSKHFLSSTYHLYGRDIANLTKSYTNDLKYTGYADDIFDDKFEFLWKCSRFGKANEGLLFAFPKILSKIALFFYFNRCCENDLRKHMRFYRRNFQGARIIPIKSPKMELSDFPIDYRSKSLQEFYGTSNNFN